jgi:C1A family cysteine protease
MNYVKSHAQDLEKDYTYTARDGTCHSSQYSGQVSVTGVHEVSANSASALKSAIEQGPVSVTVDAEQSGFMYYTGGVVTQSQCSGTGLDHAIAAVGYGTENGQEYYIVRNSWGTSWGESGYIRIATQDSGKGVCGIQQVSVWPDTN